MNADKISKKRLFFGLVAAAAIPTLPAGWYSWMVTLALGGMDYKPTTTQIILWGIESFILAGIVCFIVVCIFGLSIYYLLKKINSTDALSYTICATVPGILLCAIPVAYLGDFFFNIVWIIIFTIASALSGLIFWFVVHRLGKKRDLQPV